ncbi:MAG: ubiquinol-cytochrome c reductase iron-sulfur subunit [Acidobacteriota bacterium]
MSNHHNQDPSSKNDEVSHRVGQDDKEGPTSKVENRVEVSRRDFLNKVSGGALGVAAVGAGIVTVKYVSPDVLFEPPSRFRIGPPSDFPVNTVSTFADQLTYVVRLPEGFYAETMICQHLGCITKWHPEANLIECPCHGSEYQMDGAIARGPTVRPLYHYPMRLMPDGTLEVNKERRLCVQGCSEIPILKV